MALQRLKIHSSRDVVSSGFWLGKNETRRLGEKSLGKLANSVFAAALMLIQLSRRGRRAVDVTGADLLAAPWTTSDWGLVTARIHSCFFFHSIKRQTCYLMIKKSLNRNCWLRNCQSIIVYLPGIMNGRSSQGGEVKRSKYAEHISS